jgi:hypothetical protein
LTQADGLCSVRCVRTRVRFSRYDIGDYGTAVEVEKRIVFARWPPPGRHGLDPRVAGGGPPPFSSVVAFSVVCRRV